jgi:hypothetical protein
MSERNVVIVTGMDRSGTSWVASAMQASGVFMGERLYGAGRGNPFGHFEDEDFLQFHVDLLNEINYEGLHKYGLATLPPQEIPISEEKTQRALKLIERRNPYKLWGFKDPRAVLFLDFWKQLMPDIKVICLYRHPLEICISLFSRGDGFADLGGIFRAFQHRMGKALDFKRDNPGQMLLCNIHQVIAAPHQLEQLIPQHLPGSIEGLAANLRQTFIPQSFSSISVSTDTLILFYQLFPEVAELFGSLETFADMPLSVESGTEPLSMGMHRLQRAAAQAPQDRQNSENLEMDFFSSLMQDGLAVEDVRQKIIIGLLENIKIMGRVYGEHDRLHRERERLIRQLAVEREAFHQQISMYESRLHSQYWLTRHFIRLTLSNVKLSLLHPRLVWLKFRDWYTARTRYP